MIVTVLELPATWGASTRVLDEVSRRLAAGPATDLVLLPEAAIHGYVSPAGDFDLTRYAEPIDGATAQRCAALARAHAIHLVAPLVLREADALYNAMACFDPGGALAFVYRKRHPWIPETWATPGPTAPPVVELAGRRVTIAICYDVHFLPDDAHDELAQAEVLLFPSAWVEHPDTRADHLAELAQRFGLHVVNANWAPGVVRIAGQGGSCIIGPDGALRARAAPSGRIDVVID
ncbi:MAG: carbon-nitrogen hydrolase family protein [Myxococcales bacterium]|nr:carbon-nitrogen hydrolase family protein [Myxococcales bacterium]